MHQQVRKLTAKYRVWNCSYSSSVRANWKKNFKLFLSSKDKPINNTEVQNPIACISVNIFLLWQVRIFLNNTENKEISSIEKEHSLFY